MNALATLVLALTLSGQQASRDSVAVVAVAREIIAADNARAIERVMSLYSDTARLMPPGEPPTRGGAAIRDRYAALFRDFDPAIESRIEEVRVEGRQATIIGHNGGRLRGRNGTPDRLLDDWFLMVLVREPGGAWKIHRLMWHAGASAGDQSRNAERSRSDMLAASLRHAQRCANPVLLRVVWGRRRTFGSLVPRVSRRGWPAAAR